MKVWRGITLGFWVMLMTACVSLIAFYYILTQTVLNPTTVKKWLADSGSYSTLVETVVPMLATTDSGSSTPNNLVTTDMVRRAAKASISPNDMKAKVEPIIDATYAWLDSKSPEISFSVSTDAETRRFTEALRREVLVKAKSLPECNGSIDAAALEQASCLPWYVSAEGATDSVMARVEQQELFRDNKLTPDILASKTSISASDRLPEVISLLWVIQLIAMPIAAVVALFVLVKRRASGLIAVSTSLLLPGISLLIIGLLFASSSGSAVSGFVEKSEFAAIAEPLGKVAAKSITAVAMQVGGLLLGSALVLGAIGVWWRVRSRKANS